MAPVRVSLPPVTLRPPLPPTMPLVPAALLSVRVWLPSAMLPLPLTVWRVVRHWCRRCRVPLLAMPLDRRGWWCR